MLGIEVDSELFQRLKVEQIEHLFLVNDSYTNLQKIVEENNFGPISGILFDFGLSSWHLEKSGRGFTFQKDEPLEMSFNQDRGLTAQEIVNQWDAEEIAEILEEYGGERFSKRISQSIVEQRKREPIKRTRQLIEVIRRGIPKKFQHNRIHFATRTFQALRIAVNNELENIKQVLPQALEILEKGGRLAVISFHSGEDRIAKHFFKEQSQKGALEILFKKPIIGSEEEIKQNPRARSAKLRVVLKT